MPFFVGIPGGKEVIDEFMSEGGSDDARAEDEDVHIVMLDALVGRVRIVGESGADAGDFVGGNGGADAAAADEDAALGFTAEHFGGKGLGEVGVVDGVSGIRSGVDWLITFGAEVFDEVLLESETGVVGSNGDFHGFRLAGRRAVASGG